MDWINLAEQQPEMTDDKWYGQKWRRVFFVLIKEPERIYEGHAEIRYVGTAGMLIFDPIGQGRGFDAEEISHWMPRPLPKPPILDVREAVRM